MTDAEPLRAAPLGAIAVTGTDAADFLRAQLTNDVMRLGPNRHFLAAWCDAKGRTQMVARVCEYEGAYLLIVPRELIPALIKRLRMFVLRAKVDVADMSDSLRIEGVTGGDLPVANRCEKQGIHTLLGLPAGSKDTPRALVLAPADSDDSLAGAVSADSDEWERSEIDSGLPSIFGATQGLFVPQMLNLHWLMAIDFDKGCYPGQEVIARLHYRGTLSRRMFRLEWQGRPPAPGDDVLDEAGERQGTVVRCAPSASDNSSGTALAVLKVRAADNALATPDTRLSLLDLPYPTPA
ncbi:aminomethyl transferase [Salinisphaera dokdonensis CL-ES53]|uniref:Aminomethyl transferase n=1 Tax=Salinisphaera dokdonensis CL-ES53 TaxID=1304272 RepID=A0ABV2B2D3_9GAMM